MLLAAIASVAAYVASGVFGMGALISLDELCAASGITTKVFYNRSHKNEVALTFGAFSGGAAGYYLRVDAVALELVEELAPTFSRAVAAGLLRTYCDVWAEAVALADHGDQAALVIYEEGERSADHTYHDRITPCFATNAGIGRLMEELYAKPEAARVTATNLNKVLTRLRARAAAAGIDLSDPFLPPPDTAELRALLERGKADRRAVLRRLRTAPQTSAEAQP